MTQLSAKYTTGIIAYIIFTNKGEQIIVNLKDLPPLSRAKQKVINILRKTEKSSHKTTARGRQQF